MRKKEHIHTEEGKLLQEFGRFKYEARCISHYVRCGAKVVCEAGDDYN